MKNYESIHNNHIFMQEFGSDDEHENYLIIQEFSSDETTAIYSDNSFLTFDNRCQRLATVEEYKLADRTYGSIFESLEPGEEIELEEGYFYLDDSLDLIEN